MKLRREIRWVKSMEEQTNREELFSQKVLAVLPSTVLSVFLALVFMLASVLAVRNVYEVEKPDGGWFVLAVAVFLLVSLLQELIRYTLKEKRWLASLGVWLLMSLGFYGYLCKDERAENLLGGVVAFLRLFFRDWKAQYGVKISWYTGNADFMADGVYFVLLYLFFVVLWLAKVLRRNEILILPVIGVMTAELLVSKVPGRGALFLLLAGMLLCAGMSWADTDMQTLFWWRGSANGKKQQMLWLGRSLCLCLGCGLLFLMGNGLSQKVVEKQAQRAVTVVADMAEKLEDWKFGEVVTFPKYLTEAVALILRDEDLDCESLTNHMPEYKQVEVLQIEVNQEPKENLYLRGFCGDVYTNGIWKRDLENLKQACEVAQMEYDAVRAQIAFLTLRRMESEADKAEPDLRQISVNYTGLVTEAVYMPYYAQVVSKGIGLMGDSGFTKKEEVTHTDFEQQRISGEELSELICEKTSWDNWYENYVREQYLYVPAGMEIVEDIAIQIETLWEAAYGVQEFVTQEVSDNGNRTRLTKAQAVADWLAANTTYSLEPPAIAEETEPITYFLGTTRTGYCMHYASAAVMILREMGVPTRYASGYMVETGAFVEVQEEADHQSSEIQGMSKTFRARVLDDRAHAWVEIYLDALGWVPVEVTKGYPAIEETTELAENIAVVVGSGMGQGTDGKGSTISNEKQEEVTKEPLPTEDGQTVSDSGEDTPEEPEDTEQSGDTENPEETQDAEAVEDVAEENEQEESFGESEDSKTEEDISHGSANILLKGEVKDPELISIADTKAETQKILRYVLGLVVFIGIVVILIADTHKFFRLESVYYKQLRKEMKKGNHKRVITMINSGIYRKLQFKKLLEAGLGDDALEMALKNNYKELSSREWERYMNIVKAAAFSQGEFTQEDVKFCFDIYRDVIYKDEVW